MRYPEVMMIPSNPELKGLAAVLPDITFSTATGVDLKLQLILPWQNLGEKKNLQPSPLVVFIQGSAWTFPNVYYEMPQLSQLAQAGFAVATVTHRNCLEGHPFPAYLQDVKTAVRFLRMRAADFGLDPDRIGVWGTSSGGNAALLLGLTGDDPAYRTQEYAEYADAVQVVAECFGPTDLVQLHHALTHQMPQNGQADVMNIINHLMGDDSENYLSVAQAMSPICQIKPGHTYPPFLIIHGDADLTVPYSQGEQLYRKMIEQGIDARMICVQGGPHEDSFWSQELLAHIFAFFREKL